jgi:hypothetical protein
VTPPWEGKPALGKGKGGTQWMLDFGQLTLKPSTVQVTHHPQSYMHQTISFGCIQTLNPKPLP